MKSLTTITMSALLTWGAALYAQPIPYTFGYSQQTYTLLTNSIELDVSEDWESEVVVPVGFTFYFDNEPLNTLTVLPGSGALTPEYSLDNDSIDAIFGYGTDFTQPVAGTVLSYKTDGVPPNRVFKIEWRKVGFIDVAGETTFQIWLYETSNAIQIRIGPQFIPAPAESYWNETSPLIGFMLDFYYDNADIGHFPHAQFVVGDPAMPVDSNASGDTFNDLINYAPQYGCDAPPLLNSVFTYTPGAGVSAPEPASAQHLNITPNPASDMIRIPANDQASRVQILDLQGRIWSDQNLEPGARQIPLPAAMASGMYVLRQFSAQYAAQGTFVRQ